MQLRLQREFMDSPSKAQRKVSNFGDGSLSLVVELVGGQ